MVATHPDAQSSILKRLWIYQAERFPVFRTGLLLAVFSAASISVSAHFSGRPLPPLFTFISVWLVTFIVFFQMRVCDEWKDLEDDRRYRPERPIPSGLISLRFIVTLGLFGAIIATALTLLITPALLILLLIVWAWMTLMTVEFFVPSWLKARPLFYLISHMAVMPLIDLFITASEWLPHSYYPKPGLWVFLALSFINGCVLEIGRKVWAPQSERPGVDTYSKLLGPKKAVWAWAALCLVAWVLLAGVGWLVHAPIFVAAPGVLALFFVLATAKKFAAEPTVANEKAIESIAGLWVFVCYCLAGFAPLIAKLADL